MDGVVNHRAAARLLRLHEPSSRARSSIRARNPDDPSNLAALDRRESLLERRRVRTWERGHDPCAVINQFLDPHCIGLATDNRLLAKGWLPRPRRPLKVLGVLQQAPRAYLQGGSVLDEADVQRRIEKRAAAKKARDFAAADRIRDELAAQGVVLKDSASGTTWVKA